MRSRINFLFVVTFCLIIDSCSDDYLNIQPLGPVSETALANKKGLEALLIGAYSLLDGIGGNRSDYYSAASNWVFGSIAGSEAYTGSEDSDFPHTVVLPVEIFSTLTSSNLAVASKWGTLYDGIQRSNDVLRVLKQAEGILAEDSIRISAEAKFLRAYYHFEAKKMWDNVPFVDESVTYGNGNYYVSNQKDIWPDIESDLKYAVDKLGETPHDGAPGRANKYTAMALLAKTYMFWNKFSSAKPLLDAIISSGKYALVNYQVNFNPDNKNNEESILSVQMSVNDGANGLNGNYGDLLNFPHGFLPTQPGQCCGYFMPSQYLVNHFKTIEATGLPDFDNFNAGDVTNDEGIESSDESYTPYPGPLDPRLDWTVGRRGIPYLDWGNHPGKTWIRRQDLNGPYSPKKNSYYKSQQEGLTDANFWSKGTTANNVNLIRYADVLLWAAEVEVETGSLNQAEKYVNMIRARAAKPEGWVYRYVDPAKPLLGFSDVPAAKYVISPYPEGQFSARGRDYARNAIRYERMLELGMEGHRFFDLVRWGVADVEINAYFEKEKKLRIHLDDAIFTKDCNEYFPIPQTQLDLSAGADGIKQMEKNNSCY